MLASAAELSTRSFLAAGAVVLASAAAASASVLRLLELAVSCCCAVLSARTLKVRPLRLDWSSFSRAALGSRLLKTSSYCKLLMQRIGFYHVCVFGAWASALVAKVTEAHPLDLPSGPVKRWTWLSPASAKWA